MYICVSLTDVNSFGKRRDSQRYKSKTEWALSSSLSSSGVRGATVGGFRSTHTEALEEYFCAYLRRAVRHKASSTSTCKFSSLATSAEHVLSYVPYNIPYGCQTEIEPGLQRHWNIIKLLRNFQHILAIT